MKRRGKFAGGRIDPRNRPIGSARGSNEPVATLDPLLVALVKSLARGAAERDYEEHRKRLQLAEPISGTIGDSP